MLAYVTANIASNPLPKMLFKVNLLFTVSLVFSVSALPQAHWSEAAALQQDVLGMPVQAPKRGAVASQNKRCSEMGVEMLRREGSAADAVR